MKSLAKFPTLGKRMWKVIHNSNGTVDIVPGFEKEIPIDEFRDSEYKE